MSQDTETDARDTKNDAVAVLFVGGDEHCKTLEASSLGCFRVTPLASLEEALQEILLRSPDVLVLDLTCEHADAHHALSHARFAFEAVPSVILLHPDHDELQRIALKLGAEEIVSSPDHDDPALPAAILRAMERHRRTSQLREQQRAAHLRATRDDLTGLLSRAAFEDDLERWIAAAERHGEYVALLFIDLDGFKGINDVHGHEVGDRVLASMARRLTEVTRNGDLLARLGGDEFVLASRVQSRETAGRLASNLLAAAETGPEGLPWPSLSIGVSLFPEDAATTEELLRDADKAMYLSKTAGGHRWGTSHEQTPSPASPAPAHRAYRPPTREVEALLKISGQWKLGRMVLPRNRILIDHLNQGPPFLKVHTEEGFLAARTSNVSLILPRSRGRMIYALQTNAPKQRVRCNLSSSLDVVGTLPLRHGLRLSDVLMQSGDFLVLEQVDLSGIASSWPAGLTAPGDVALLNARSIRFVEEV